MESLKITIACFVGAALGVVVSYLVQPALWWVGLLAGIAAGYIAYDMRAFLKGVLRALRKAVEQTPELVKASRTPLGRRRVFEAGTSLLFICGGMSLMPLPEETVTFKGRVLAATIVILLSYLLSCCLIVVGLSMGMILHGERCQTIGTDDDLHVYMAEHGRERAGTYGDFFRWLMTGWLLSPFWIIGFASRWTLEGLVRLVMLVVRCIAWLLVRAPRFTGIFIRELFLLVHSDKRLLCGSCAMMGVLAGYLFGGRTTSGVAEVAFAALAGGIVGAGLGLASFNLVSQRLLKGALQERA